MTSLWQTNRSLAAAARWGATRDRADSSAVDLAILVSLGAVAALATTFVPGGWRVPGHAILRGTLPLILGISFVPRRTAGLAMSGAAAVTFAALRLGGAGLPNLAACVGLLCLGPAIDLALVGARGGWQLYARFAAAGLAANLIAFAVRLTIGAQQVAVAASTGARTWAPGGGMGGGRGVGMGGGRGMGGGHGLAAPIEEFWLGALVSFALCGAIAGLVCAAIWFRARPRPNRPAAP